MAGQTKLTQACRSGAVLRCVSWTAAASIVLISSATCLADTVILSTGGLVRGRLQGSAASLGQQSKWNYQPGRSPKTITVTTVTGGRLVLDSTLVASINRRPMLFEEFEVRSRRTPDDVEALWTLAEWCKSKGLKHQREETLRRLLVIEPEDSRAHLGLGQSRYDGQWKTHDEEMRSRGFVKYEGRYVAVAEVEILKKHQTLQKIDQDWANKIRSWSRALYGDDPEKRRVGRTQLANIHEPEAIPALNKVLGESHDPDLRMLYIKTLAQIPGPAPVKFLVSESLFDDAQSVRIAAQEAIAPELRPVAAPLYVQELHNSENLIVRRAGLILEKVGDESSIPGLINAVVTTHSVPVQVIDNSNTYSFGSQGVPLPSDVTAKLLTGQYPNGVTINNPMGTAPRTKIVMVNRDFQNAEILGALQTLTNQSFGFDKDLWRRWWATRTTLGQSRAAKQP